jgi:uncharacterized protein with NRDE domain
LALYFRTFEAYPLVVAANRDEHYDRPSATPALLNTRPQIIAGLDLRARGTWLGVNHHGLIAGILNRRPDNRQNGPFEKRSRGLLCMDVLKFASGRAAREFLQDHRVSYNPFTLLFADRHEAYISYNEGSSNDEQTIITQQLDKGLHVLSSAAEFEMRSAKADRVYAQFAALAPRVQPINGRAYESLAALQAVLADHSPGADSTDAGDAICVHRESSGTVSSSVIYFSESESLFNTFFCPGPPCRESFSEALTLNVR